MMYQSLITLSLLIPITGFIGSNKNPDIILGLLVAFFTILVTSPLVSKLTLEKWLFNIFSLQTALTNTLRNAKYYFIALASVLILTLVLIFTPLGFPYSASESYPTPQRQWILVSLVMQRVSIFDLN